MEPARVGAVVRAMRRRREFSQRELAARAAVSQQTVSRVERGRLDRMRIGVLRAVVEALDATLAVDVRTAEPVLRDAKHARLQAWLTSTLRGLGWWAEIEASFNHFGDRGRIDVAAFHPVCRIMLIVEVKSRIDDVQDVLGRLDVKNRVASVVARERGWPMERSVPALVVAESRTARRRVADYAPLFARYSLRSRAALAWLRRPSDPPPAGLLLFVTLPPTPGRGGNAPRGQ